MSLSYSYPGIYLQELPLSTHTITPAPTSITAFVGYTHPWKTAAFGTAIQLFSFSDYETYFGGLYTSGLVNSDVAQAVYAFFLNGGSSAYVVGLQPEAFVGAASIGSFGNESGDFQFQAKIIPNIATPTVGMQFYALEPCDIVPMTATITNLRNSTGATPAVYDTFDLIITYGSRIEVYRSVNITNAQGTAGSLDKLINNISTLVTVEPMSGTSYGAPFPYVSPALPSAPGPANFTLGTVVNFPDPPGVLLRRASRDLSAPMTSSMHSRPTLRLITSQSSTCCSCPLSPTTLCFPPRYPLPNASGPLPSSIRPRRPRHS